ncbi:MAG: cytochrome C [Moorea sp. SIOASIH]|nr:cytochrome C [Moorena sp. SIOASIH]
MSKFLKLRNPRRNRRRSAWVLLLLLIFWSISIGWGLERAVGYTIEPETVSSNPTELIASMDPVSKRYKLGKELYLENCSRCHIALPPEVLPTETWRRLLLEPQEHYGTQLPRLLGPSLLLTWQYLRDFSRPHNKDEEVPYRMTQSRYFKALHPQVKIPRPFGVKTCVTCHPGVANYDYRTLTPEWQDAP